MRCVERSWRALLAVLILIASSLAACAGDEALTQEQAKAAAERLVFTLLLVIAGREELETLLESYPPECQSELNERRIAEAKDSLGFARLQFPALRDIDIEALEFREARFEATPSGFEVLAGGIDVVVDGQTKDLPDYLRSLGFVEARDVTLIEEGIAVSKVGGKVHVDLGTCEPDPFRRA
jgi:hypothetical protein